MYDEARLRYRYDPVTGVLYHAAPNSNRVRIGDPVGHLHSSGYLVTRFQGKTTKVHRLIWLYQTGSWPVADIDHIDGDRSNNTWSNLRECSRSQNLNNMRYKPSRSGYKGVLKRGNSYAVKLRADGVLHHIGSYPNAYEAALAYDQAASRLQGPYARTNAKLGLL